MLEESDLFQAADVLSFTTTKMLANETLRDNFLWGRHRLTALRKGEAKFGEVFDVERAAKSIAILRILNVVHGFRWKNCRFYVNPITRRLELIAYNAYGPHPIVPIKRNSIPLHTAHRQDLMPIGPMFWASISSHGAMSFFQTLILLNTILRHSTGLHPPDILSHFSTVSSKI